MEPVPVQLNFLTRNLTRKKLSITTNSLVFLILCSLFFNRFVILSADSLAPRGVSLSRASLYDPQKDFSCLDGSKLIPFSFVNDDYCDCFDGSDEPGTSACSPRGVFFCSNIGHQALNIPTSRVNDGICDCCDGTDEVPSNCENTCEYLGRAAREEAERQSRLMKEGYTKRLEMSQRGHEYKREKEEERKKLENERNLAENIKKEKESIKEQAEEPEKIALDKIKAEEDARKELEAQEEKSKLDMDSEAMFTMLDSNGDSIITIEELKTRIMFDKNHDGQVSDEEASFYLNMDTEMHRDDFLKTGWQIFKPAFMMEQGLFQPPSNDDDASDEELEIGYEGNKGEVKTPDAADDNDGGAEEEEHDEPEQDQDGEIDESKVTYNAAGDIEHLDDHDHDHDHHQEEENDENEDETEPKTIRPPVLPPKAKYDDETQALIDVAQKARDEFNEADRNLRDINKKLEEVQSVLEIDFGEDDRYAPLLSQCFDYEDREYIYTLCPFKNANQRGKGGGGEVNLGKWSDWSGEPKETNKFAKMLYSNGQGCWNGPNRSLLIILVCGTDNRLNVVTEPSRCVYEAEFETPSACNKIENQSNQHDEL